MTAARPPAFRVLQRLLLAGALLLTGLVQAQPAAGAAYAPLQQLLASGKAAEALEQLDARIANQPRDPQLRFLRAVALTDLGRQDEAIGALVELTETYPELAEPYNNLAVLYAARNQLDKARDALEMAVRARPDYAVAHENLADIYARMALDSYTRASGLDPAVATHVAPRMALLHQLLAAPAGR